MVTPLVMHVLPVIIASGAKQAALVEFVHQIKNQNPKCTKLLPHLHQVGAWLLLKKVRSVPGPHVQKVIAGNMGGDWYWRRKEFGILGKEKSATEVCSAKKFFGL